MDKNSKNNRTDLLAAGRKKLQQYRLKKDGKGSKSSGKVGKSEGDGEAGAYAASAATKAATVKLQVADLEKFSTDAYSELVDLSASHTGETSEASVTNAASSDNSLVAVLPETGTGEATFTTTNERPSVEPGNSGFSSSVGSEHDVGTCSIDPEMARVSAEANEVVDSEAKSIQVDIPVPPVKMVPPDMLHASEAGGIAIEVDRVHEEDQVPDEGEQISRSSLTKVEGDRRPSSPEHDKGAEAYAKAASVDMDGQTCGEGKSSKLDDVSSSAGAANEIEGQMADTVSDASSAATPELVIKKREDVKVSTSGEESRKIPFASGVFEGYNAQEVQSGMLDTIISMEGSLMPNGNSSIRLSWLAEVVRGLDDDEFIFLLNSRVSATTPRNYVQLRGFSDVLEILKEQLYTTNFMKDILHLQLVEQMELQIEFDHQHQQLVDDISMKGASLSEVRGESDILSDELARCKSELHLASRGREDFQKENDFVKRECEKLSSRANELQFRLESSQQEVSRVSTELADCRDLVAALQVEKENLDASLTLMTQERRKLEAESESSNNENRAAELAECKASVQLLQSENINLNGSLALMTEERMKLEQEKKSDVYEYEKLLTNLAGCKSLVEGLEEEKEYFSREMEKLSAELKEQKGFVESLQVEIANLNTIIALISEERDKLGGEKYFLAIENKKLSAELADYKDQIAGLDVECSMVVDDLKEASLHIEQISEENSHLIISLEIYKAKIKELDTTNTKVQSQSEAAGNQIIHFTMPSTEEKSISCHDFSRFSGKGEDTSYDPFLEKSSSSSHAECSLLYQLKSNMYDDSLGYTTFKGHLEQAENLMGILETAIEHMHSHSASFRNSSSNVVAPAVSKLIQAFESKSHIDDHEADEEHSTENQSYAAPYVLSKVQLKNLRAVLKELVLDAENASELYKGERNGRELANAALSKLKVQYEALREQSRELEEANLELLVVYEIIKQHVCDVEEKKGELLTLYEALRQQERIYRMESAELKTKLTDYESGIAALQRQLDELQESSDDKVFAINHQMDILHEEVAERTSVLEKDYNSIIDWFVEADGKLDASVGIMCSTVSVETHDGLDIGNHVAASVEAATKVIADLQEKLEAARGDYESLYSTHKEMNERFNDLQGQNELATSQIHQIYGSLRKLVNDSRGYVEENETSISNEKLLDSLNTRKYDILMEQLRTLLVEKLQLESANDKLNSELMDRTEDIEKMNKRCLGSDVFKKLVEDLEGMVKLEGSDTDTDEPALYLESLIYSLVQKYKEANAKVSLSIENLGSKDIKLNELQEQNDHSSFLVVLRENEVLVFKESLRRAMEDLVAVRSVIQDKVTELEQSEQRVSSLREKLSIAVAKGKGLILQRDGLKQSLAETSSELERCLQELRLKNASLHEMEIKLKTYSEAGERVEALESELSYIRNSATALRESFLLKDSVLQRIEEILEDLELPEHFHAQDVLGKVDWLARSVIGNALPLNDGDQKSSVGGGLYSDAGFVPMDPWKEDLQPASISGEDLRRKYEELQSKFYGLAEQNEMLEQSLMERNNLLKRLEEILDRVTMPLQLRSMEPEDRIGWLGGALSDAVDHCSSLQQKIDNCETLCESRTAELEESKMKISDLEAVIQSVTNEKERLAGRLDILTRDYDNVSEKAASSIAENDNMKNIVTVLEEKLDAKLGLEEHINLVEGDIRRLEGVALNVLQDSSTEHLAFGTSSTEHLEFLLTKLREKYKNPSLGNPALGDAFEVQNTVNINATLGETRNRDLVEQDLVVLKKELEEALSDLIRVKEERDTSMESNQSLVREIEALDTQRQKLQGLLNQEEQKSASVREKLNLAVRKGKSLVQQRDSMKQTIDEITTERERLNSEIKIREIAISEYEQKIKDLCTYQERTESLESESLFLKNRLAETEQGLQDKGHTLGMIFSALAEIGVGFQISTTVPVEKIIEIGKLLRDLHAAVASSEHDARKSKRAAELLLAELNEVQERNDGLLEELAKSADKLSEISKKMEIEEAHKHEALSHLEYLSAVHTEERENQIAEFMVLKSGLDQLRAEFTDINGLLDNVLSEDLKFLQNLEATCMSSLKSRDAPDLFRLPFRGSTDGSVSTGSGNKGNYLRTVSSSDPKILDQLNDNTVGEISSLVKGHLQGFTTDFGAFKDKLDKHSFSIHEEANVISDMVGTLVKELTSLIHYVESLKGDIIHLEAVNKEKDAQSLVLRRSISLLYEACKSSVMEIGNWKAQQAVGDLRFNLDSSTGTLFSEQTHEEHIRAMADRLLSDVNDFLSMQVKIVEDGLMETKSTISNLQKELHEKDIQNERICVELVSQIKEAEATAMSYLQELQPAKAHIHDLEQQVRMLEDERSMLQKRVKELQDSEVTSIDLQERVRSLTDALAAKEQELDAMMQALDEEESQMDGLKNKIEELERVLHQKNIDLENAEASRGKAMKKLSITKNKFDELHNLSGSLLSEVEKLQSELRGREAEISFLRQEVTRCTNDSLLASQMGNKGTSDEILELFTWIDSEISRVRLHDVHIEEKKNTQVHEYKDVLQKQILSVISELEDLRAVAQSRDNLLQLERSRVEELLRKGEYLENTLRDKESQVRALQGVGVSGQGASLPSEIMEVEPVINKWTAPGPSVPPQVRSLRKGNNDQVAIAIDVDHGRDARLEDEDDDKAHGFKSLTTSKLVPSFTRPVTNIVDGLWVSCDRALMRQPAVRLGVIIYWVVLHALLATFVV